MYNFKTLIGLFTIKSYANGGYILFLNDNAMGSYDSAEAAAENVAMCKTGIYEWDKQGSVEEPKSLSDWIS